MSPLPPYEETRKAMADAIADSRQGVKGWLRRHNARVRWEGKLADTGDLTYHERVRLTIELPDPNGRGWLFAEGHGTESSPGTKPAWRYAFDEAVSQILDTLATRLVERAQAGAGPNLLREVGLELHEPEHGNLIWHDIASRA